jgi:hypothetical protein
MRMLSVVAAAVTISGAALVGVPKAALPSGLTTQTVARSLADSVPPNVHDVRINGVYGSAHEGTWQFVAHMTWRSNDGAIHGGSTELPQNGGQNLVPTELTKSQLDSEEHMGWTIDQVQHAFRNIDVGGAALAMIDLEITVERGSTLVACSAAAATVAARCAGYDASGDVRQHFADRLLDEPALNGISVQRASAPVTTP